MQNLSNFLIGQVVVSSIVRAQTVAFPLDGFPADGCGIDAILIMVHQFQVIGVEVELVLLDDFSELIVEGHGAEGIGYIGQVFSLHEHLNQRGVVWKFQRDLRIDILQYLTQTY